jgi:hypothetical protein
MMASEGCLPVFHVLYGLRIAANVAVPGLVAQNEPAEIDVRIRLKEKPEHASIFSQFPREILYTSPNSNANEETNLRVGMLAGGNYFGFFYSDGARFAVERHGHEILAEWPENYAIEDVGVYLIGPVIGFVLRLRGITCLHASSIAIDGQAIALMGAAGAGKSTTAAAFAQLGYPVLSDDVAVLGHHGDRFFVESGYPRVNLWAHSVNALFGSIDALPRITPTWGKRYLALDDEYRFKSASLPLRAIYLLDERDDSLLAPVVEELAGADAFTTLVANTYVNYLLDADMRAREFEALSRLIAQVPVRRVTPIADTSKVFVLCETISADASQLGSQGSAIAKVDSD